MEKDCTAQVENVVVATDSNIRDLLQAILTKIDGMEKKFGKRFEKIEDQLLKLDVYNACLMTTTTTSSSYKSNKFVIDIHELRKFGVPAENLAVLNQLEESLKSKDFSNSLVCPFSVSSYTI